MMLALVVAFLASLPLFDQLLNDADALHRDVEERGHR
jgi:hypothetical protein